jgi:putative folate metabolism gamma-glutamate ligase
MRVQAIKTHRIVQDRDLNGLLDQYVTALEERSVLAITSKIVSICQGRLVPVDSVDKQTLVEREADLYLPPSSSQYWISLTIVEHLLIPMAGVDESNVQGQYVLWPLDAQGVANRARAYLRERFSLQHVGVLITDSKTSPLCWGVTGTAIAHSGFRAINDYRGRPDIHGRPLQMTTVNVADALAAAAVLVMGEGDEQTPLAVIDDLPFVHFRARDPSPEELHQRWIGIKDDLYAPLLEGAAWQKGGGAAGRETES